MDTQPPTDRVPSKKGKIFALFLFFIVLFTIAGWVGLPLATGVVLSFFLTIAVPLALVVAFFSVFGLAFLAKLTGRRGWPLFDAGLQIFVLTALISTGIFLVRFPAFLREGYPMLRETIEERLSTEHSEEQRDAFFAAMERFWHWNVGLLLQEGVTPTAEQPAQMQAIWKALVESGSAPCPDCPPVMSPEETAHITNLVDEMLPPARAGPRVKLPLGPE
jgi:hypothetical protein